MEKLFFEGKNIMKKKYPLSQLRKEVGLVFQYPEQQFIWKNSFERYDVWSAESGDE